MSHTVQLVLGIGGVAGALLAIGALASALLRPLRRLDRRMSDFQDDWYGRPARPGYPAVPGIPERLAQIEKETRPNGGGTMKDALRRIETWVQVADSRLSGIEAQLNGRVPDNKE